MNMYNILGCLLFACFACVLLYFLNSNPKTSLTMHVSSSGHPPFDHVCLICVRPSKVWAEFLSRFMGYRVTVIVDDDRVDLTKWRKSYPTVSFVQTDEDACHEAGFVDLNHSINKIYNDTFAPVSGWEKALHHFCTKRTDCARVWFLEEDVFVFDHLTFAKLDTGYPDHDFLSPPQEPHRKGEWHWPRIRMPFRPPYRQCLLCACRLSRRMLDALRDHARRYGRLCFGEALLPTLAIHENLRVATPSELSTVVYRHDDDTVIVPIIGHVYHPVKDTRTHERLRKFEIFRLP